MKTTSKNKKIILKNIFQILFEAMLMFIGWLLLGQWVVLSVFIVLCFIELFFRLDGYWENIKKVEEDLDSIHKQKNMVQDGIDKEHDNDQRKRLVDQRTNLRNKEEKYENSRQKNVDHIKGDIVKLFIASIIAVSVIGINKFASKKEVVNSDVSGISAEGETVGMNEVVDSAPGPDLKTENTVPLENLNKAKENRTSSNEEVPNICFYLLDGICSVYLDPEEEKKIFYLEEAIDAETQVREHVTSLLVKNQEDSFSKEASSIENAAIEQASNDEAEFKMDINEAEECIKIGDFDRWNNCVRDANDLVEIIDTRIKVVEAGRGNRQLCFMVANDYQILAYECIRQNKDATMILNFYMKAIDWAEKALTYDVSPDVKQDIYNYIIGRYQDIMNCVSISEDIRVQAETIHDAMENIMNGLIF